MSSVMRGERKQMIILANIKHPEWTAKTIAAHSGCMLEYVIACKHRYGLNIPVERTGRGHGIAALGLTARRLGLTRADLERFAKQREHA